MEPGGVTGCVPMRLALPSSSLWGRILRGTLDDRLACFAIFCVGQFDGVGCGSNDVPRSAAQAKQARDQTVIASAEVVGQQSFPVLARTQLIPGLNAVLEATIPSPPRDTYGLVRVGLLLH